MQQKLEGPKEKRPQIFVCRRVVVIVFMQL